MSLLRGKGRREVALVVRHEVVGNVDGKEHTALQNLRAGTLEVVIDKLHLVDLSCHKLTAQLLGNVLTTLGVGLVGKLCEIAGNRQSKFRHFLCHFPSYRIDKDVAGALSLILRDSLLHQFDHVVVETAAQAAVAREHHQRHTLHIGVGNVERSAHVGHGCKERFQDVLQTFLVGQHVADERLGVMQF